MLLEIDATATISTFPSSLNGFDFASLSSLNFVGRNPVFPELRTEKVMIAPTDQQGLEQLRNTSIKLAERWQREAVAKVTPAVKWGTRPGSRSHQTEFFRPMLSVMKAKDLDDAIGIVNSTGFGLISRLQSLDTREQTHWTERIEAGNLYINRTTTGAIVQRQPFGGLKKSAIAAGTNKPETRSAWKTSVPSLLRRLSENSLPFIVKATGSRHILTGRQTANSLIFNNIY